MSLSSILKQHQIFLIFLNVNLSKAFIKLINNQLLRYLLPKINIQSTKISKRGFLFFRNYLFMRYLNKTY